ncbi:MAG: DNA polymerase III subunit gamma/tau [Nitrospiraceae bacterium]
MDYQVSARKYRPGTFDDVIGQPHVVQTLMNAIATKRIAHAFLFSGTRGVGKTTVARILAKALNCEQGPTGSPCNICPNCLEITQGTSVDVIEIDGASNTGVDDVREIRENVKFTPFRGSYRIYIIDEVHMLSNSAFNALLKTLEEPPAHVVFILATTEIHKIPPTILSRCQHYNFRRIARTDIMQRLRHVATQNDIAVEDRSLTALARASEGSMRDALSLLDQAVAFGGKTVDHTDLEVLLGAVPQEHVRTMIAAVIARDSSAALRVIAHLLDKGHELRSYCADVVEYVRNLLVAAVVASPQDLRGLIECSEDDLRQFLADSQAFSPEQLQEWFRIFTQAEDALRLSAHPRFVLETAAIRAARLLMPRSETSVGIGLKQAASEPAMKRDMPPGAQGRPGGSMSAASPTNTDTRPMPPDAVRSNSPPPAKPVPPAAPANKPRFSAGPIRPETHVPPAPTAPPVAAAEIPAETAPIRLDWEQFQERVAATHPNIAPFLEMGRLVGVEGNHVILGFGKQATVARSILEKEDNLRTITTLCSELAGQALRVRVVELTEAELSGPTMAQVRAAKVQEQKVVLLDRARAHPLVKQALELFGGELVEVRQTATQKEAQK